MLKEEEILEILNQLIEKNYLQIQEIIGGFKVVAITLKGKKEIFEKNFKLNNKKIIKNKNELNFNEGDIFSKETEITEEDKIKFKEFDFFLNKFNPEQKKAIISNSKNILTIAGAGSGKTTVLTKRIEFLCKFKSIKEDKVLAITFTRKAKNEMAKRIEKIGLKNIKIETFNSFCEKELKKKGNLIYDKRTRVAKYSDKIAIVKWAFEKLNFRFETIIEEYFNRRQIKEKSNEELFFLFVNDLFSIIDYYKNLDENLKVFYENEKNYKKRNLAKMMYNLTELIQEELKKRGLRDFSDQVIDTLKLYSKNPETIPKFDYILIDEYQDLNFVQFKLIKKLNAKSIFAVGDPRQAIYGWRGSNIKYILNFKKEFENTEIILLKKNYRSTEEIVEICNQVIKPMNLIDLISSKKLKEKGNHSKSVFLQKFDSENLERIFIMEAIKNSKNKRNNIFVLARTNKILQNLSEVFLQNGIDFVIKSEEEFKSFKEPNENQVILATVHSIKGMEAEEVYVVSANSLSYPNKVQDNFVLELIKKENNYNKFDEELRLFYVAISRAKTKLVITYTGNLTKFITEEILSSLNLVKKTHSLFDFGNSHNIKNEKNKNTDSKILINMLKDWRTEKAKRNGDLPLYMIISNKAIEELAKYKPSSKAELFSINGLGPTKIMKYGEELLKIISG